MQDPGRGAGGGGGNSMLMMDRLGERRRRGIRGWGSVRHNAGLHRTPRFRLGRRALLPGSEHRSPRDPGDVPRSAHPHARYRTLRRGDLACLELYLRPNAPAREVPRAIAALTVRPWRPSHAPARREVGKCRGRSRRRSSSRRCEAPNGHVPIGLNTRLGAPLP